MGEGEGVAGRVPAAQRRHGLSGAHLHRWIVVRWRRMHGSFVCRQRSPHAPGSPAAHEALRRVRQEGRRRRRLPALQAHLPAPPAPLLRLQPRRRRTLQSSLVQVTQRNWYCCATMSIVPKVLFFGYVCERKRLYFLATGKMLSLVVASVLFLRKT